MLYSASVKELSMPEKKTATPIVDYFVNCRRKKNTKLDAIDMMIEWKPVAKKLDKTLKRTANAVGKPAYPALVLFKGLVLQRMYNLSDVELEEQINDRFSFRRFVGLGVSDDVPDATTFCRFRQELLGQKLSEKLFQLVLGQYSRRVISDRASALTQQWLNRPGVLERRLKSFPRIELSRIQVISG